MSIFVKFSFSMRRLIYLFLFIMILFLHNVYATMTRLQGLGIGHEFWAVDNARPYYLVNPVFAEKFSETVYFELFRPNPFVGSPSGGILFEPISLLTVGIFSGHSVQSSVYNNTLGSVLRYFGSYDAVTPPLVESIVSGGLGINSLPGSAQGVKLGNFLPSASLLDDELFASISRLKHQDISVIAQYSLLPLSVAILFSYSTVINRDDTYSLDDTSLSSAPEVARIKETLTNIESEFKFRAGASLVLNRFFNSIDASAGVSIFTIKNDYNYSLAYTNIGLNQQYTGSGFIRYHSDGAFMFDISARANFEITNNQMRAFSQFKIIDSSALAEATFNVSGQDGATLIGMDAQAEDKYSRTATVLKLGVSDQLAVSPTTVIIFGFSFQWSSFRNEFDGYSNMNDVISYQTNPLEVQFSYLQMPFFMGFEEGITSFLKLRFGLSHKLADTSQNVHAIHNIVDSTNESIVFASDSDFYSTNDSQSTLSLGFTVWLGSLEIDLLGIISNSKVSLTEVESWATGIAATYRFSKKKLGPTEVKEKVTQKTDCQAIDPVDCDKSGPEKN